MPIYEYTCRSCQSKFEKLVRTMSDADQAIECPDCGSRQTERALSVFAVGAEQQQSSPPAPGMCQRCGREGPCPME